jgi:hypothetical protein
MSLFRGLSLNGVMVQILFAMSSLRVVTKTFIILLTLSISFKEKSTLPPNYGDGLLNSLNYKTVYSTP